MYETKTTSSSSFAIFKNYYLHIFFWLMLFAGWYLLRYQAFATKELAATLTSIKVADLAVMVYISNYVLVPKLLYGKKYILFAISYITLVFCFSILKMKIEGLVMNDPAIFSANFKGRIYDNIIPHFLLVSTGVAFKLVIDYAKAQKRIRDISKEKTEAELNFLKAQMNPHFLFNALNSVYFLIDSKNYKARNALHTFSEMLRYQLYETNGNKINVEKEIIFLQQYTAVQQLRKNDNLQLEFNADITNKELMIQPLLLVPFVENAFKHLSRFSNGKKDIIKIDARVTNNIFHFTIKNSIDDAQTKYINYAHGIGLTNVQRRLELLYPGKHLLQVKKENNWYEVQLVLE